VVNCTLRLLYPRYPMNLYNRQFQPRKPFNCLHPNDDKNGECGGDGGGTDDSCRCFGNMCTCIYCVFCIISFMYIYSYLLLV